MEEKTVIQILQENLCNLRTLAGYSVSDFSLIVGLTRQSIYNLEANKIKLSKTQYIAIRTIFDYDIRNNTNSYLSLFITLLIDNKQTLDVYLKLQDVLFIMTDSRLTNKINNKLIKLHNDAIINGIINNPEYSAYFIPEIPYNENWLKDIM